MIRFNAIQICPWCKNLPNAAALAAASILASSSTIMTLLPPNSSATSFKPLPASAPIRRPTSVEPVKEIMSGIGCITNASPISEPRPTMTLTTPGGKPASSNSSPTNNPDIIGVSDAAFTTTVFPVATAGATERIVKRNGKFQGPITPITPFAVR